MPCFIYQMASLSRFLSDLYQSRQMLRIQSFPPKARRSLYRKYRRFLFNRAIGFSGKSDPRLSFLGYRIQGLSADSLLFLFREIFIYNHYYFHTTRSQPVIFDCGANIGMVTVYFKWLYPDSEVHSFEPSPTSCELAGMNISANHLQGVTLQGSAVCDY